MNLLLKTASNWVLAVETAIGLNNITGAFDGTAGACCLVAAANNAGIIMWYILPIS